RLRYRRDAAGWSVSRAPAAGSVGFEARPLRELAAGIAAAQGGLDLAQGALAEEARRPEVAAELDLWRHLSAGASLPRDGDAPVRGRAGDEAAVLSRLPAEGTALLLRETTAAHRAHIDEILLGALSWALREWTGAEECTVALESHGREELSGSTAPAETLGWFTNLHPVRIAAAADRTAAAAVRAAKDALR